jgi:tetratricopeptide (TPR) repeat protein
MKTKFSLSALLLFTMLSLVPAFAQMATVKGVAKDTDGTPIATGTVDMVSHENGRKISLKTQKNGEFMSIGVPPGVYHVYLSKDGKQLWDGDNFQVNLSAPNGENILDLDLQKKQMQAATGNAKGMTEEQKKQMQEALKQQETVKKENMKIGELNKMLQDAKAAHDANNDAQAVAVMQQAAQSGGNYDQVWGVMGQYQTYAKQYDEAAASEKKAIEIANASTDPKAKARVAQWQNLLGQAYSRTKGHSDEAVAAYQAAAQADPANAGMYYFNMGAVLTNSGKVDDANAAFDKAIAADPTRADAYYEKAVNLMQKATADSSGKLTAPPGTAENFNKYLELQPDGPKAEQAKQMLAALGEKVQTSFGKTKKK